MKYRSRTDIIVSMLEAARHGATKTKIMYSSYLSSYQFRVYLELVIKNSLLGYDSTRHRYSTTDKGLRLLELYGAIGKLKLAPSALSTSQSMKTTHYHNRSSTQQNETATIREKSYMSL